jgi:hypothetical protein
MIHSYAAGMVKKGSGESKSVLVRSVNERLPTFSFGERQIDHCKPIWTGIAAEMNYYSHSYEVPG